LKSPFMQGDDIRILQSLLNLLPEYIVGNKSTADGIFGPLTHNAVKEFQRHFNLKIDGIVGQETFFRLGHRTGKYALNKPVFSSRILKNEARGADVTILQNRLAAFKKTFLNRPASGIYNIQTVGAVKKFQENYPQLTADGIVTPKTYKQIFIWAPLGGRNLRFGRNGVDTYFLQFYLYQLGYYHQELHGYFDSSTKKAVEVFQTDAEIKVDGAAGPQTYLALGTSIAFPQKEYLYRVKKGDTVFKIASFFNKNMQDIIELNHIKPPDFNIFTGQLLKIPVPLTFHLLQKADTFLTVSEKYNIPRADLKKANDLFPDSFLLPDEMILLPRFQQELSGNIVFLNEQDQNLELSTINLANCGTETLEIFKNSSIKKLFLSEERKKISLLADDGKSIIIYDLNSSKSRKLSLPLTANYMNWSKDSHKIVVNNGLVIDTFNGKQIFSFNGSAPQWFRNNRNLLYYIDGSTFKKTDITTGLNRDILLVKDDFIWSFSLKNDDSKLLFFAFLPPGRVSASFIYDLLTRELAEIGKNDFFGEWSRTDKHILLQNRDYYGDFFPWFHQDTKLYTSSGDFIRRELYAKGIELNVDNFSGDDSYFLCTMYNPNIFYQIPLQARDIYVKKINSQLITQITSGEMIFNPIWL